MTLGIAVIGAGRIGKVHARTIAFNRQASLAAVTDVSEAAAANLAEEYHCPVRSVDDFLGSADIEAVVICTPTGTHADLIEAFARAGKAIFCEKPVDLSLDRVRACLTVVEDTNTKLMVGFNRRFDPDFRAVRAAVDAGQIGQVEMVQIISRDPRAPDATYIRASGGIFKDMTIHDFDMARFLLPDEPVSVIAAASVLTDPEIGDLDDFDSVSVILTTASGRQCTISNSRRATYGYDQRIEVHGSKGMVCADNQRPAAIEIATSAGFTRPPLHDFFMTRYAEAYEAEMSAFIAGVAENRPPTPSGQDGLQALRLAEAAILSVKEQRVVHLPEI